METESKAEKFKRLAERRTEAVLEAVRKLANLANSGAYEYSPDQVDRIFKAIQERLLLAQRRFEAERRFAGDKNERFRL